MPILALFVEYHTSSNHKIMHNASYFIKMSWSDNVIPTANIAKISESETIVAGKFATFSLIRAKNDNEGRER